MLPGGSMGLGYVMHLSFRGNYKTAYNSPMTEFREKNITDFESLQF
jgi:hypothetical protein